MRISQAASVLMFSWFFLASCMEHPDSSEHAPRGVDVEGLLSSDPEVIGDALFSIMESGTNAQHLASQVEPFLDDQRFGDEETRTLLRHQAAYALAAMGSEGIQILCGSISATNEGRRASAALGLMTVSKWAWEQSMSSSNLQVQMGGRVYGDFTNSLHRGLDDENENVKLRCQQGLAILGIRKTGQRDQPETRE